MSWEAFYREDKIQENHKCNIRSGYEVEYDFKDIQRFGNAVGQIIKVEGHWLADNGEYATVIYFCPFCGKKLE